MNTKDIASLVDFARNDPRGFCSALINTIDTHAELPVDETGGRMQQPREQWAVEFLLLHNQGTTSCADNAHTWVDDSHAGPDSGNMNMYCSRCNETFTHILY